MAASATLALKAGVWFRRGRLDMISPDSQGAVPTGPQWAHEIKHDGFRFIARRDGDHVRTAHVRFAPKATGVPHCRKMTRCASFGLMHRTRDA
jgi:hypothetical protein